MQWLSYRPYRRMSVIALPAQSVDAIQHPIVPIFGSEEEAAEKSIVAGAWPSLTKMRSNDSFIYSAGENS